MDKKAFLDMFKDKDKNYISSLYEDIELCRSIEMPIYTKEFVTPDIYIKLKNNQSKLGVKIDSFGVFDDCERKMLKFYIHNEELSFYEMELIEITNKSKFKNLSHRDYLGSIMSLGIKRNLFGDLVVKDNCCFIPISSSIYNYVIDNLTSIGNCPCSIKKIDMDYEGIPKINFEEKVIIATSLRVDSVIPGICNLSRAKSTELINAGGVLLNYQICDRKDKIVETNDTITIRGIGKYKVKSIVGETGKGRIKILIGKYV